MRAVDWLSRLRDLEERHLWRLVVGGMIVTSLLSAVVEGASGRNLIQWLGEWLLDFSTDLAGGAVVVLFVRYLLHTVPDQQVEAEILEPPAQTTYFIDASEVAPPPPPPTQPIMPTAAERLEGYLKALRQGGTAEARQAILNQLKKDGLVLAGLALIDIDLQAADLQSIDMSHCDFANAKLRGAQLVGANLQEANLFMAQLIEANLQTADLRGANLERAFLSGANMQQANLRGARVGTSLWRVNLSGADLRGADLSQAELFRTNLQGAWLEGIILADTKINDDTVLPDGSLWSAKTDINRFIDPQHPQFWSPQASRVTHETE